MPRRFFLVLVILVSFPALFVAQDLGLPSRTGLVVCVSAPACDAGAAVLARGGNAVDAAVTTALAYIAWYACQRSISATTAGTVQLVIPILTAAGAVVLLGEPLTVILFVAAALVAAGMWLARPPARAGAS